LWQNKGNKEKDMAENFYEKNKDIQFYFDQYLDLKTIIDLKENFYQNPDGDEDAPANFEEALDNTKSILNYLGHIASETIFPNSTKVDEEGASFDPQTKTIKLASGTIEDLNALKEAGVMGLTLPRKYGGLNQCETALVASIDMVSAADAGLMTLFGLQGIGESIYHFADEEVKDKYLPKLASGEYLGAMTLTEAGAGSDLGSVLTKATYDEDKQKWFLNGTKRFITNGGAEVQLVLARTEPDTDGDVRGLSMFLVEIDQIEVNRIEHKLGINGSPTCELVFDNSEGMLIGKRRFGLVKYLISLMNSARLGCAAQGLGLAQIAFDDALQYSDEREQFGKKIKEFPPIANMLAKMKLSIESTRALVYQCAWMVDNYTGLEHRIVVIKEQLKDAKDEQKEKLSAERKECVDKAKKFRMYADILTPLAKIKSGTMANEVTSDAIQVLGGVGYTKEFRVERYFRDARIVDIYEGTGEMQVKAAISGVLNGYLNPLMDQFEDKVNKSDDDELKSLGKIIKEARNDLDEAIAKIKGSVEDPDYEIYLQSYERNLCDMLCDLYCAYLLLDQALISDRKKIVARKYIGQMRNRVAQDKAEVLNSNLDAVKHFNLINEVR